MSTSSIPGYTVGTWDIDTVHSEVGFTVRHMMVSKVRGRFNGFEGEITTGEDLSESSFSATIDLTSIDTDNEQRDDHLRSTDFFAVEEHPTMTYRSTSVTPDGDKLKVEGDLSLHGVTRKVPLNIEINGFSPDPFGGIRSGFSATGEISRGDFDITFNMPMDGGGVVVGDKIQISIEIEAVLRKPE